MTNRVLLTCLFTFFFQSLLFAQNGVTYFPGTASKSTVAFKDVSFNFGEMPQGSVVNHTFEFKNTGKQSIYIREVTTSCGCTTPQYSNDPIKPHHKGKVTAKYDSTRLGHFHKTLNVVISDNETIVLTIEGDIKKK